MVSFQCEGCGDTLKKPQLQKHGQTKCRQNTFSCVDCQTTFHGNYQGHTSCISEAEKYQKALYKDKKKGKPQEGAKNNQPNGVAPKPVAAQEPVVPAATVTVEKPADSPSTTEAPKESAAQTNDDGTSNKKKRKRKSKVDGDAAIAPAESAPTNPSAAGPAAVESEKSKKKRKVDSKTNGAAVDAELTQALFASIRSIFTVHGVTKSLADVVELVLKDLQATRPQLDRAQVQDLLLSSVRLETGKKRPQLVFP